MVLYNSLTRRKEELPPPPGPIRMYVCGPTVPPEIGGPVVWSDKIVGVYPGVYAAVILGH